MGLRFLTTLLFVVAVTAAFLWLALAQLEAPKTPAGTAFSQEQAFATLSTLIKEERPHVVGTPENAVVRDRIVEAFRVAGYTPEVQSVFQCSPPEFGAGCAALENIIAVHKGTGGGKAVLATAHYDSVAAGPGAGDDGAGTAVMIELARHMATKTTKNDVIFLITDAEETGLRGAIAFAEKHPLMKQVGIVVNVEARGASGPSMMFETGPGSANLMGLFARTVGHPTANSLTYEIYKLLPNDTDFSVYRKAGLTGFNFAFSNSASLYHSAHDNLTYLNRDSLQHHGDNAFALTEALADIDLDTLKATSDASYFDVHGTTLIVWPSALNLPIAILSLLAFVGLIVMHRGAFSLRPTGWAAAALIAAPITLFLLGFALSFPLGVWPGVHPLDHPEPWPARIALASAGILTALLYGWRAAGPAGASALFLVNWLVLSALAVFLAATIPGAAYPLLLPVFGAAVVGWVETVVRRPGNLAVATIVGFVLAAFFWLTYLLALELVLGFDLSQYKILVLIPFVLALIPVFAWAFAENDRGAGLATAGVALVVGIAAFLASRAPTYTPDHPRGQNIVYYDDRSAQPRWLIGFVGAPDKAFLKATGFGEHEEEYLQSGIYPAKGWFRPAEDLQLAPPTLAASDVSEQNGLSVLRGTLRNGRAGIVTFVVLPTGSGVRSLRVANETVIDPARDAKNEPVIARLWGLGDRETPIEITFDPKESAEILLLERSALPQSDEATALVQARTSDAAPVHSGDGAVVMTKVNLKELKPAAPAPN